MVMRPHIGLSRPLVMPGPLAAQKLDKPLCGLTTMLCELDERGRLQCWSCHASKQNTFLCQEHGIPYNLEAPLQSRDTNLVGQGLAPAEGQLRDPACLGGQGPQ